ncbi:F plasmid transfer operon family protein [Orientia chuto str. Dubai]|uniref:F plasmid transfer operon family protein n=1 Tax=Orientia chuto str. Dubai TaxID=1359168 RepID=A0A0F3MIQ7_9RICK|nr:hypothetical protein [Candidatus Orientia mediorientalis]KJV55638.1 F plasmid transfer operon family protein [Orientia chuto str. Dubai]
MTLEEPYNRSLKEYSKVYKTGLLPKLKSSKYVVPVLYLMVSNDKKIYPIAREIISEDKIIDNVLAIYSYYQIKCR